MGIDGYALLTKVLLLILMLYMLIYMAAKINAKKEFKIAIKTLDKYEEELRIQGYSEERIEQLVRFRANTIIRDYANRR